MQQRSGHLYPKRYHAGRFQRNYLRCVPSYRPSGVRGLYAVPRIPHGRSFPPRTLPRAHKPPERPDLKHPRGLPGCHAAAPDPIRIHAEGLDMAGGWGPHDPCRAGRFAFMRTPGLTQADYCRYKTTVRCLCFGSRTYDPALYLRVDCELQRIIGALLTLDRTGLFSASFNYDSMLGELEIQIYAGPQRLRSEPLYRLHLDCRHDPLVDNDTGEAFCGEQFIEWLTLLVQ